MSITLLYRRWYMVRNGCVVCMVSVATLYHRCFIGPRFCDSRQEIAPPPPQCTFLAHFSRHRDMHLCTGNEFSGLFLGKGAKILSFCIYNIPLTVSTISRPCIHVAHRIHRLQTTFS